MEVLRFQSSTSSPQSEGLSEDKIQKECRLYLLSTWIHPNMKPHVGWLFESMFPVFLNLPSLAIESVLT